jgi:hypothetical protein
MSPYEEQTISIKMHNKQAVPAQLENGHAEATCPLPITKK